MKYLKTYEDENNIEDVKTGDIVYCVDSYSGVLSSSNFLNTTGHIKLEIGQKYTVANTYKRNNKNYVTLVGIKLKKNEPNLFGFYIDRFTKDPNNPRLIKAIANKYNL